MMKRTVSRRSHSWWWDSHISPKNSKWLAENLEEMDRHVKRMLKLIEEEGDSLAKKAEMYYQKRPELISLVEDFYRMYRSLAERYDHLTGELRKNIPSELQSQGSGISDAGSDSASPVSTPDQRPIRRKSSRRAAGFEVFLGSGGGSSDLSRKEGDESSSSSSDSELDFDAASSINNYLDPPINGDDRGLHQRIIELESELYDVKEKLRVAEEENSDGTSKVTENGNYEELLGRVAGHEEQLKVVNKKLQLSEEEISRLKLELGNNESRELNGDIQVQFESAQKDIEVRGTELKSEIRQVLDLQEQLAGLETNISAAECKIEALVEELRITNKKLHIKEEEIVRLKLELEKNGSWEATSDLMDGIVPPPEENEGQMAKLISEKHRSSELLERITALEADVLNRDGNIEALEEKLRITKETLQVSEAEIARLKDELNTASCEATSQMQVELESARKDMAMQEAELESEKRQLLELQEQIMRYKADVLNRDQEIKELKVEISNFNQSLSLEKSRLLTEISSLLDEKTQLEANLKGWESRGQSLEEEIGRVEAEKMEIQTLQRAQEMGMQSEIEQLKADIAKRDNHVEDLNKNLDTLKLKYDMLVSEKDELNAKVITLMAEVSSRDDRINQMDKHLNQLHIEHVELIAGSERARKLVEELQSRAKELEEVVERQRVMISDGAEEKREAIRQLCFSLEHYRDGYHQLRQAFIGHKRQAVFAA